MGRTQTREGENWSVIATSEGTVALYRQHGMEIPTAFWFRYGDAMHRVGWFVQWDACAADGFCRRIVDDA